MCARATEESLARESVPMGKGDVDDSCLLAEMSPAHRGGAYEGDTYGQATYEQGRSPATCRGVVCKDDDHLQRRRHAQVVPPAVEASLH
ncbi:hypothetical protein B296_00000426 [Ensete ventricosum]|uniref:Uncharacterized protein n=1 Tax=Ensete ventricosum TaxID=4639 RepID=A0A427BBJ5_ENSVE|nr:hypothetical protein B296_00000426 [Ensete ventricosum]